jgi:hypothetical protein
MRCAFTGPHEWRGGGGGDAPRATTCASPPQGHGRAGAYVAPLMAGRGKQADEQVGWVLVRRLAFRPVPPANKKARLVRERGDACTAVSRAEVSLPREAVRVSMSVGTSARVRVRVSCWFDHYRGGWGRCWVWIPRGDAFQTSFVSVYGRRLVINARNYSVWLSRGTCLYRRSIE